MIIKLTLAEAAQFAACWLSQHHRIKSENISLEIDVPTTNWPGQTTQPTLTPTPPLPAPTDFFGGDYSLKREGVADANKLFLIKMVRSTIADIRDANQLKTKTGTVLISGGVGSSTVHERVDKMYDLGTAKVWVERYLTENSTEK